MDLFPAPGQPPGWRRCVSPDCPGIHAQRAKTPPRLGSVRKGAVDGIERLGAVAAPVAIAEGQLVVALGVGGLFGDGLLQMILRPRRTGSGCEAFRPAEDWPGRPGLRSWPSFLGRGEHGHEKAARTQRQENHSLSKNEAGMSCRETTRSPGQSRPPKFCPPSSGHGARRDATRESNSRTRGHRRTRRRRRSGGARPLRRRNAQDNNAGND